MALPRLDSAPRVGEQAFDALHSAIMSGELPSGTRLQIRSLASALGISVMPVREAITRLEELGLVESEPYRGATVKRFTRTELLDIYAVRRILEVEAAVQATRALGAGSSGSGTSGEVVARMREAYAATVAALEAEDVAAYLDCDEAILAELYRAGGNPVLMDTIRSFWGRCRPYKIIGARGQFAAGRGDELLTHQRSLIEAVARGDAGAADRITAASLDAATERIRTALAEQETASAT